MTTVIASMVSYSSGLSPSTLKVLRVLVRLRPLRICYVFDELKSILDGLIHTLPSLAKNILSLFGVMLFYAILGLHMFSGALYNRCRYTPEPLSPTEWPAVESI